MVYLELALMGIALSMDAFAVSITEGISLKKPNRTHALKVALYFGGFQALMPLLGYMAGNSILSYIEQFDHWIAFLLLSFIGGRMIYEACKAEAEKPQCRTPSCHKTLLILSVATSIDALAVGISLAITQAPILIASLLIGVITAILCFLGVLLGRKLGALFQKRAEITGGIVLILIGLKILIEHLFF